MDRERAKKLLPIIQAFADGEQIQFRLVEDDPNFENDWLALPENLLTIMTFPAPDYDYRIKPKPREFWMQEFPSWKSGDKLHVVNMRHSKPRVVLRVLWQAAKQK